MTQVFRGLRASLPVQRRTVVTVGVFDGVHLAHRQLLHTTVRLAARLKAVSVAITFDPDPQRILDPAHAPPALMSLAQRVRCLQALGIEWVWVLPFTRALSRMPAERFVRRVLAARLRAAALVIGDAFVFGHGREGDVTLLRTLGRALGIRVVAVRPIRRGREPVSSSRIRRLIERGALPQATALLGHPPICSGLVVRGAGRGRRLGFPTANLRVPPEQLLPPRGVYAVFASWPGRGHAVPGVMNLGVRPTFGRGPLACEVHVLARRAPSLGQRLWVAVWARLREERRFSSAAALQRQIRRDIARARRLLSRAIRGVRPHGV